MQELFRMEAFNLFVLYSRDQICLMQWASQIGTPSSICIVCQKYSMKYIYSTSQMSKLSLTLHTFSVTGSVAGLFLTWCYKANAKTNSP